MFKIVFLGARMSGKTALCSAMLKKPFELNYYPTIGARFSSLELLGFKMQLWDCSPELQYERLLDLYIYGSNLLLYCVDLSGDIDEEAIKAHISRCHYLNPDGFIILVGTKADTCLNTAEDKLKKIQINVDGRVVTAASTALGLDSLNCMLRSLLFQNIESGVSKGRWDDAHDILPIFPASYKKIWEQGRSPERYLLSDSLKDYYSALEILKDYCKGDSKFFSSIKLLFTHCNRHHTEAVRELFKICNTQTKFSPGYMSVVLLLKELEQALIEKSERVDPKGSLARRILFIQQQSGVNIISIKALNKRINVSQSADKSCQ
ncbi:MULTISPECIES: DUF5617 domain-containing protein [unclassified Legionella]|uniref:DUF5617 domain-containing protein n=1 Tax=unclassified Legionella TaxID=2622702 RepID=UPI0010562586|nr:MULTISPECIES: DUF5617 domain-containing protein [unclassified Legionella]MDI9819556.1 DUF5617 domain-containing protein [Legionella sp. PL877]